MRAAGLTDAQILRLLEVEENERAATIREQNRIRQQNHRARNAVERDSHGVTRDVRDGVNALSSKKEVNLESKKERALTNSRGTFCPADFTPSDSHFDLGQSLGLSRSQVSEAAGQMVEWSTANRNRAVARKADWSLTFTGWLRRNSKPPQTADPPMTAEGRELERKTREYEVELERRKRNGHEENPGIRSTANGSGNESADPDGDALFPEIESFRPAHKPIR